MSKVKKINLLDATNDKVYDDEFGWISSKIEVSLEGVVKDPYLNNRSTKRTVSSGQIYVKDNNGRYVGFYKLPLNNHQILEFDFGEVFVHSASYTDIYISVENPKASFLWAGKNITKKSKIEVYKGEKPDIELKDFQIREGLRVQKRDRKGGTFVVTKLFEQPNRENNLCVIERLIKDETAEAKPITIKCNQKELYSVPYETYEEIPDEISIFNQPLNEDLLAPFIEKTANESKDANLYWLPIENASAYTVSLYKKRNVEQQKYKIYLLERFEVDRNQHWITLHNLIGNGYIVLLEAESREGSVIARTRGINVDTKNLEWF